MKVLNPMSVFPAWISDKATGNPQGIWPWKPAGLGYRTSTGLGEKTPVLQGTNKIQCAQRPWGKEHWPHRRPNKTTCQCLRVSYRGVGWQRLTTGMGELAAAVPEGSSWHKPSWRFPLTQPYPVHHQLLEFIQTHVHWVCDAIQSSHLLSSLSPPHSIFPSIRKSSSASILPTIICWGMILLYLLFGEFLHKWLLKNPCMPGIKPIWSWYMILFVCCWILFTSILLRIFASMFVSDTSL